MPASDRLPAAGLVDLPGLVQSIAAQRRSGMLVVAHAATERRVRFAGGQITAITGGDRDQFAKALGWAGVVTPEAVAEACRRIDGTATPECLARHLLDGRVLTREALLDTLDLYGEEEFTVVLGWAHPVIHFAEAADAEAWADFQQAQGMSISPGGLLLECLRRQDELTSVAGLIPDPWDVLIRDHAVPIVDKLPDDARVLLSDGRDGIPAMAVLEHPRLAPFRATMALAHLRRLGILRLATTSELVVHADAAHARGNDREAYGIYRRTVALGLHNSRVDLHIAEIAERLGEKENAARAYLAAASQLSEPAATVVALRNALRLGADRENPLLQLVAIYIQLKEKDDAIDCLMELARLHEGRGALDLAVQSVREAQELGADAGSTALMLARLAAAAGDHGQASLQLELAARAAQEAGRIDDAIAAWQALLAIAPGRCEYAHPAAEVLAAAKRVPEAMKALRTALQRQRGASEDILVAVFELLARLDPNDTVAHDWLAKIYEKRRNSAGATQQLRLVAAAHERNGDIAGLAVTYERIIELGGEQVEMLDKLAAARLRLGQVAIAAGTWARAGDAALAAGQLKQARQILDTAIAAVPDALCLRHRLAQVANRAGDRQAAIAQFRAAADLARGAGDRAAARDALMELCRLRPDDLIARMQLAENMLDRSAGKGSPEIDRVLKDVVRVGMRTTNFGIALEHARRRIALAGGLAYEQRSELVALLNRINDQTAEVQAGRELLNDLLEQGEIEKSVGLLMRLVASQPDNADLVLQLAEVHEALGDGRQAYRFYRHAVGLLQVDDRLPAAHKALDQMQLLSEETRLIAAARKRIDNGQVVDWEQIRQEIDHEERRRLAKEIGTGAVRRMESDRPTAAHVE